MATTMVLPEFFSPHIAYGEAVYSQTAIRNNIDNTPESAEIIEAMKLTATLIYEPVVAHFGDFIGVSSFYRCLKLNKAIKGSKTSQHMVGEAIDMDGDMYGRVKNIDIFNWIKQNLTFDQLIKESRKPDGNFAWVHCSYTAKGKNRKDCLEAVPVYDKITGKLIKYNYIPC